MRARVVLACIALLLAGCAAPEATPAPTLSCPSPCETLVARAEGYAWEPHVAADPLDPDHLVAGVTRFVEGPASPVVHDILVAVSRDGGRTWSAKSLPHGADVPSDHPLATATSLADPIVAFLPDGTVLLAGLGLNAAVTGAGAAAQGFRVFVARSADGGESFPETVVVAEDRGVAGRTPAGLVGAGLHAPDAPNLAVGPDGSLLLLWRFLDQPTPGGPQRSTVAFSTSADGGRAWSEPQTVDTGYANAVPQPARITPSGAFLVSFVGWEGDETSAGTRFDAGLARSTDGGRTWSAQKLGENAWTAQVVGDDRDVLAVYPVESPDGRQVVTARLSRDGGATFAAPFALASPDLPGSTFPTLAGDARRAYVTWFHAEESGYALRALALDDGVASPPVTLARDITGPPGALGEYFGLAALPDGAYAVWATNEDEGLFPGARLVR